MYKIYKEIYESHNCKCNKPSYIIKCKDCSFAIIVADDATYFSAIEGFDEMIDCKKYAAIKNMDNALK